MTQTYDAHQDDLFSVLAPSDANGVVAQRYNYGDYGNRSVLTAGGLELDESDALIPHGYTGRLHHPDSGLIEYRYRWLLPETGSFVQRDPLGYVDGMNTFRYCNTKPYYHVDSFGLLSYKPGWLRIKQTVQIKSTPSLCKGKNYDPNTHCCENGIIEPKVPIWISKAP